MILYYVRHGDPIYNPDSLTELGHKQAEALSKRFSLYGLDEIYASTSIRAQQTAEPTCKILNKEISSEIKHLQDMKAELSAVIQPEKMFDDIETNKITILLVILTSIKLFLS